MIGGGVGGFSITGSGSGDGGGVGSFNLGTTTGSTTISGSGVGGVGGGVGSFTTSGSGVGGLSSTTTYIQKKRKHRKIQIQRLCQKKVCFKVLK